MIQLKNKYQFRTYDTKNIGNGLKMCTILNRETTKKKNEKYLYSKIQT